MEEYAPHFTWALQNNVSIHLCRLFMNLLRWTPLKTCFYICFLQNFHFKSTPLCYADFIFPHFSSKWNTSAVSRKTAVSQWHKESVGVKEARHAIYNIPHRSRDLSSNIQQYDLFSPRPDKYIMLLLDLSKPLRAIFPSWVSITRNFQNMPVIPQQCLKPITFFFCNEKKYLRSLM